MYKVSILMSVYNETLEELKESVTSILNQTYSNFEFIIVVDNPREDKYVTFLEEMKKKDNRIKTIYNAENIGLAMSMNKAAKIATGQYYARMDSDDISSADRIERQVRVLDTQQFDLVFSNYICIDENSEKINGNTVAEVVPKDEKELKYDIIFKALIHHPTVMMTQKIFTAVGGYRNYPCSQDQDLWIRMLENGCRFYMIPDSLLQYRIRLNSVSQAKMDQQHLTIVYIKKMFLLRIVWKNDIFSKDNYDVYIKRRTNKKNREVFYEAHKLLLKAKSIKNKNKALYLFYRFKTFIISKNYRNSFLLDKILLIAVKLRRYI